MGWVRVCGVDDLADGEAIRLDAVPPIAVYRVGADFYATDDSCTHSHSSLSEDGYLVGDQVECAYHFAKFCVRDGRALSLPATVALQVFEVRITGGEVLVEIGDRPYREASAAKTSTARH